MSTTLYLTDLNSFVKLSANVYKVCINSAYLYFLEPYILLYVQYTQEALISNHIYNMLDHDNWLIV